MIRRRMPFLRKFALLAFILSTLVWAQSGSPSAQSSDSKSQTTQLPRPPQDSDKKPMPDQTSPAPLADSTKLEPIKTQRATYPFEAQKQKIQGEVVVKILVSETGDVESAEVISGDPILGKSAVDAVKKWKFKPFIKNGKPVKVSAKLPVDFAFSDKIMEKGTSADGGATSEFKEAQGVVWALTDPSDPSAWPPQRVQKIAGEVSRGLLIRQVAPVYPDDALRARIEGVVILAATINKDGIISELRLISGPKKLAPAAIGAVQQWRYRPYLLNGSPVEVQTEIRVNFHLR
jgi:TonB family protein